MLISDWACQYPGRHHEETELIIGLDFGTSYTKVVIGNVSDHYAIPLNPNSQEKYLLPGIFSILDDDRCVLGNIESSKCRLENLKIALLDDKLHTEEKTAIIIYIALVLRKSRNWIMTEKVNIFKEKLLDWYINIGVPTDSYHNTKLNNQYKEIVRMAWVLSILPLQITWNMTINLVNSFYQYEKKINKKDLMHDDKIGIFPEFVAQIAGYVRSPSKKDDLHLLIDIGAGTVDITTFNVYHTEGEPLYPVFARKVSKHGTVYLMRHRLKYSGNDSLQWSPFKKAPSSSEFARMTGTPLETIKKADKIFKNNLSALITSRLTYTKKQRHPLSKTWRKGVPTFLCGGGSYCDTYRQIIQSVSSHYPLIIENLPQLPNLEAPELPRENYHRLSVAVGLSFNIDDIGVIKLEHEIEDLVVNQDTYQAAFEADASTYSRRRLPLINAQYGNKASNRRNVHKKCT